MLAGVTFHIGVNRNVRKRAICKNMPLTRGRFSWFVAIGINAEDETSKIDVFYSGQQNKVK